MIIEYNQRSLHPKEIICFIDLVFKQKKERVLILTNQRILLFKESNLLLDSGFESLDDLKQKISYKDAKRRVQTEALSVWTVKDVVNSTIDGNLVRLMFKISNCNIDHEDKEIEFSSPTTGMNFLR